VISATVEHYALARDKFAEWKEEHRRARSQMARDPVTLAELAKEYLDRARTNGQSAGWITHQRQYLKGPMAAFFGKETLITKITRQSIEAYLSRFAQSVKRTTANKHRACLRRMFQFAIEQGYVRTSPAADVQRLKHDGTVHNRFLTAEEFRRLREAAEIQRTARRGLPCVHGFSDLPEYLDLAVSLATRPTETLKTSCQMLTGWAVKSPCARQRMARTGSCR